MKPAFRFLAGVVAWVAGQAGVLAFLPHAAQTVVQVAAAAAAALGLHGAAGNPDTLTAVLDHLGKGWKTAAGVVVAFVAALLSPDVAGAIGPKLAHIAQVAGAVLAALGLYHAASKPAAAGK